MGGEVGLTTVILDLATPATTTVKTRREKRASLGGCGDLWGWCITGAFCRQTERPIA